MTDPASTAADDELLVARAQRDRQAFALLYRRYVDPVHRYCYRRLGSREAAEDATSLVFAKAFAGLPSFRAGPTGSFRAWLFAIAHHVITDRLRARRPEASLALAMAIPDRDPRHAPEEAALAAEAERSVALLLASLPPDQRRVVELRMAGLTGREAATALGRSLPAVKIAQVRAYGRLRQLLAAPAHAEATDGAR
jgi:RNA polymerase sigma-70 factor (ECF subfamily)